MTAEAKQNVARLLDTAGDYLRDGYRIDREAREFTDDPPAAQPEPLPPAMPGDDFSSLPLAYRMEEADGEEERLECIADAIRVCHACPLGQTRIKAVPGEGAEAPKALIIGEGPGAEEDASGRPFVGPAGQLLDKMLASIGLSRQENCFIANVVKCRPPGNRDPQSGEIAACAGFLERQIDLLKPKAILCVGRVAACALLETADGIGRLRGRFFGFRGIPLLATYHPSALLRDETLKRPVWEDLKRFRQKLADLEED